MNWIKQNWIKLVLGAALVVIGTAYFLITHKTQLTLRCPDSFTNSDEKIADLKKFSDAYYVQHPNATEVDLSEEMVNQWKANNCTEALKRYNDYLSGNVDANTKATLGNLADEYLNSSYYENPELGFSFQYPNSLVVEGNHPEQPNMVAVFPKSKLTDDKEPMTAIIISEATDSPEMSAEQWLNGPNSGYKASRDGQYTHRNIGGQDAVITSSDWVVVKSPDGQRRISIAYLVEQDKGAKPLKEELKTILDTFSFVSN